MGLAWGLKDDRLPMDLTAACCPLVTYLPSCSASQILIYGWKLVTSAKALYPRIEPINWTDTFEP